MLTSLCRTAPPLTSPAQSQSKLRNSNSNSSLSSSVVMGGAQGKQKSNGRAGSARASSMSQEGAPSTASTTVDGLPIKEIPGSYGPPVLGAFMDKMAFYWTEGVPDFFDNRLKKYNSSVFRMNMIPGPPGWDRCPVIMCVDQKSYRTLFDTELVDKKDILIGTFYANLKFSGGHRPTPYHDSSEEKHTQLKGFLLEVLKGSRPRIFPEFRQKFSDVFVKWEANLKKNEKFKYSDDLALAALRFNIKTFLNADPTDPTVKANLGQDAAKTVKTWLLPLFLPLMVVPLPKPVKPILAPVIELLAHTFPVPHALIKPKHDQIIAFFKANSQELLDVAETKFGLDRDDALHNLLFSTCFNSWGGIQILFPQIVKRLSSTSPEYQQELSAEVRRAVRENGGITPAALSSMPLVESAVYEILRLDPPVPYQFGIARKDMILESHDAAFRVKKGEMIAGYMKTAGKDSKVFKENPEAFNPKRFLGEEGQNLVQYVLWSNGPQTETPTTTNKQCPGKDYITIISQLLVAEMYSRYGTVKLDGSNLVGLDPPST